MGKGYRMLNGKAYLLNGTVTGYTPEQTKAKALDEAKRIRATGFSVRLVKRSSIDYAVYQFPAVAA